MYDCRLEASIFDMAGPCAHIYCLSVSARDKPLSLDATGVLNIEILGKIAIFVFLKGSTATEQVALLSNKISTPSIILQTELAEGL